MRASVFSFLPAVILSLLLVAPLGAQETDESGERWVNDQLFLSLYPEPNEDGERLALLSSGDRLFRLGPVENGFARVETEDGTLGWINENFLVDSPPARERIAQVEAERAELAETVDNQSEELAGLRQTRDQLVAERNNLQDALESAEDERAALSQRINQLEQALAAAQETAEPGETAEDSPLDTRLSLDLPARFSQPEASAAATSQEESEYASSVEGGMAGLAGRTGPLVLGLAGLLILVAALLGGLLTYLWQQKKIRQRFGGLSL